MKTGLIILNRIRLKWQLLLICQVVLLTAIGTSVLVLAAFLMAIPFHLTAFIITSGFLFVLGLLYYKPWSITLLDAANLVDNSVPELENSTYLLAVEEQHTSLLAALQRNKIAALLPQMKAITPPNQVFKLLLAAIPVVILAFLFNHRDASITIIPDKLEMEPVGFISGDTTKTQRDVSITQQTLLIKPPSYTGNKPYYSNSLTIKALEGTTASWTLQFDAPIEEVQVNWIGNELQKFTKKGHLYSLSKILQENAFYKLIYADTTGRIYESGIYQIEVFQDEPPILAIEDLERFTTLEVEQSQKVKIMASLKDDYGLASAAIIATVSKGSGESVKFREERFDFDRPISLVDKVQNRQKTIDLAALKMEPGDELYFYVEAFDNKQPKANRNRTETYFISIRDTTQIEFSLEGSLGVDQMPEYFRSQRQLIIDTEKLIKDKKNLSKHDFNFKSNELGYDQKALRLKYGQFMGEEFETGITEEPEIETEAHEEEEHDPLEEYSHKHDSDNEHNLVPEEKKEDPLHAYQHAHDDPEEATLYTVSIRAKLKAAMTVMWDAELYLRLYEPEKSLPFQYQALELIKEIKNHARIYVHRMGFDPPPIKEEKRLSGDIAKVETLSNKQELNINTLYPAIRSAIIYIDKILLDETLAYESAIFKEVGAELAQIAIDQPGRYLVSLQHLQNLNLNKVEPADLPKILRIVQHDLLKALPDAKINPAAATGQQDELSTAFSNELNKMLHD